jgi:hypothetical protein
MRILILFILSFLISEVAIAQIGSRYPIPGAKELYSHNGYPYYLLSDLTFKKAELHSPLVYGGTKSNPDEFLPMGWIGNCTGTAVGPKVIFTAAHCVFNGKQITFNSRFDGKKYSAVCTRHPEVNTNNWFNDYALCRLTNSEFPSDMPLASFLAETPEVGEKMLLNGFGAPNVGTHYWGPATVARYGSQDIYTCGPSNLGGGDSGGSFLKWTDDRSGKSGFQVVGVNSRGGGGCSLFNRINSKQFQDWSRKYERDTGNQLCGISLDCGKLKPDVCPFEQYMVEFQEVELDLAKKALNACIKAN